MKRLKLAQVSEQVLALAQPSPVPALSITPCRVLGKVFLSSSYVHAGPFYQGKAQFYLWTLLSVPNKKPPLTQPLRTVWTLLPLHLGAAWSPQNQLREAESTAEL